LKERAARGFKREELSFLKEGLRGTQEIKQTPHTWEGGGGGRIWFQVFLRKNSEPVGKAKT